MFPLLSGIPVLRVAPAVPPGRDVGNACSPVRRGAGPPGARTPWNHRPGGVGLDIRRGWEGPRDGCRGALKEES